MRAFQVSVFVAIASLVGFICWSAYLKDWCEYRPVMLGDSSWQQGAFGAAHGDCVKKAWWRP